jgi:hypothetical protein
MLIYLWSRANTSANVSIMGMVSVKVRALSLAGTPTISHAISKSFFTLLFPASVLADLDRHTVLASEAQQRCRHMLDQSIAKSLCSENVLYRLDLSMKHSGFCKQALYLPWLMLALDVNFPKKVSRMPFKLGLSSACHMFRPLGISIMYRHQASSISSTRNKVYQM